MDNDLKMSAEAERIMLLPWPQRMAELRTASTHVRTEIALVCALRLNQSFPDMCAVTAALVSAALHRDDEPP